MQMIQSDIKSTIMKDIKKKFRMNIITLNTQKTQYDFRTKNQTNNTTYYIN